MSLVNRNVPKSATPSLSPAVWKEAGVYVLLVLLFIILLNMLFSVLLSTLKSHISLTSLVWSLINVMGNIAIIGGSTFLSSVLLKKWYSVVKTQVIVYVATSFFTGFSLLQLLKDLLIREIHGIPIVRNYPSLLISLVVSVLFFSIFSTVFLSGKNRTFKHNTLRFFSPHE